MSRALIIAFMLSFILHGGLLCVNTFEPLPPRAPALRAFLRPPPAGLEATPDSPDPPAIAEELLKNSIVEEPQEISPPPPPPPRQARKPSVPSPLPARREVEAARRKLAEFVFYPEQARQLGLEGTVTLYVELAADGRVENVSVVASSGFAILDNAAVRGFYAVGRLPGESDYWEYAFRLE